MQWTDQKLMLAVRDGDVEKLGVLYDRYSRRLFDFLYRMTGDAAAGEDLVQEVFLRMLRYRNSFGPESEFRAWMYQIARNARADFFAKHRLRDVSSEHLDAAGSAVTHRDAADQLQHAQLLERALMTLTEDKREILILARYQEMKYSEIASLLAIEVNTVKTRVHRAMADLREAYLKLSEEGSKCSAM